MGTPTEPKELFSGRFTVYETPGGGFHLAYLPDGDEELKHFDVPAAVVAAAKMAAEGGVSPLKVMNMLRGRV